MHRLDLGWRVIAVGPTVLFLVIFTVVPIALMLTMSFYDVRWEGGAAIWTWRGLANYAELGSNPFYAAGLRNTFVFVVAAVVLEMVLGFGLALLVSRLARGRTLFLAIFLLPILIPAIVIGAIWKLMYNFDFGLFNDFVGLFGLPHQDWLGNANLALASVILVDVWHWTSFCFLLLLAGLESLPQDVYEAAKLDGASPWQELRHVTLPLMLPVIVVTLVTRTLLAFKVFDEVYLLTQGGPGTATEVLSFTVFRVFFDDDREGFGSAMSISIIAMVIALLVIGALATRRRGQTVERAAQEGGGAAGHRSMAAAPAAKIAHGDGPVRLRISSRVNGAPSCTFGARGYPVRPCPRSAPSAATRSTRSRTSPPGSSATPTRSAPCAS